MTFQNSEQLRTHILNYHDINTQSSMTQNTSQYVNYVEHIIQNVIIISSSSAHNYTAVKTSLFCSDNKSKTIHLNMKSTTIFID